MTGERIVSVSLVLNRIQSLLQNQMSLETVWIQGEISNLTKHRSGHYYFSIKDNQGAMNCVMFSSYVRHLNFDVQEGMKVLLKAETNIYPARGSLQLYVKQMKQDGIGVLFLEYEQRKKRLLEQGYFDEDHKTQKPEWIEKIAVITAKEGAAIQDVCRTIQRRWPMMKITLYPALVQGQNAASSIIQQLKKAEAEHYDAILLVRGGGSFEDLFSFNDEELIKTIYHCQTYIVSGVGHETDTTLCDLVSDHRSVTPTAAAQWVSFDQYEIMNSIHNKREMMLSSLQHKLRIQKQHLFQYQSNPYLKDPMTWIIDKRLKLDAIELSLTNKKDDILNQKISIETKMNTIAQNVQRRLDHETNTYKNLQSSLEPMMKKTMENQRHHLQKNVALLDAFSPLKVIQRGYSVTSIDGHILHTIDDVSTEDRITTQLSDGFIQSKIIKKEKANGE